MGFPFEPLGQGLVYNVVDYGADPTGTNDSTAAIQAALDDVGNAGSGTVFIPPGIFTVSAGLTIPGNTNLLGIYRAPATSGFGGRQSEIQVGGVLTSALFTVSGSNVSVQGLVINGPTSPTTQPVLSAGAVSGITLRDVFVSAGLGGIYLDGTQRIICDNVAVTSFYSQYGFSLVSCGQAYLSLCTASPQSGSPNMQASYYLDSCETVSFKECGSTGAPPYSLELVSTNDSEFYDFEPNGASTAQIFINGGGDLTFVRVLVGQPAPTGIDIENATGVQFLGGIVADASGSLVTGSANNELSFVGVSFSPTASNTNPSVSFTAGNNGLVITGCTFTASAGALAIDDATTYGSEYAAFYGNTIVGYATPSIAASSGSPNLVVHSNPGFNPVGPVTVAVPASGTATAALPYDATYYITQSTAASSVAVQGQTIDIPIGGPTAVFVPAGQTLTPTYTTAPTWVVQGH